jgi:fused signal recognition particle receptor
MFGLRKTLGSLFKSNQTDEAWFDALEESLILSDVGLPTTEQLISKLRKAAKSEKTNNPDDLKQLLVKEVENLKQRISLDEEKRTFS